MGNPRVLRAISILLSGLVAASPAHAVEKSCAAKSGDRSVAVLELYTSEGCNSCPPADKWVNTLPANGFKAGQVVPLALHVDYWDYIGWKDRFAKPEFTQRQKYLASLNRSGFVFTPQLVLNGKNFRQWGNNARFGDRLREINRSKPRADISVTIAQPAPRVIDVNAIAEVPNLADRGNAAGYIALYENNLSTDVKAGENQGVRLIHDFVVREWIGPLPVTSDGKIEFKRPINLKPDWKARDSGVAVFVQNHQTGEVLQAVSLQVCA